MFTKSKNKTFNYQPRFSAKSKVDVSANDSSLMSKWKQEQEKIRKPKSTISIKVLLLLLVLLLIGIYYLETFINN